MSLVKWAAGQIMAARLPSALSLSGFVWTNRLRHLPCPGTVKPRLKLYIKKHSLIGHCYHLVKRTIRKVQLLLTLELTGRPVRIKILPFSLHLFDLLNAKLSKETYILLRIKTRILETNKTNKVQIF